LGTGFANKEGYVQIGDKRHVFTASVLVQKLTSVALFQLMVSPFVSSKEGFIAMFSSKCSIIVGSGWVVSIIMPFDFVIFSLLRLESILF
jgi:hypothetical protein